MCFSASYKMHGKKGATFDIFSVETHTNSKFKNIAMSSQFDAF